MPEAHVKQAGSQHARPRAVSDASEPARVSGVFDVGMVPADEPCEAAIRFIID